MRRVSRTDLSKLYFTGLHSQSNQRECEEGLVDSAHHNACFFLPVLNVAHVPQSRTHVPSQ
jgi:hypothetical protein